ncbi:hypothetical protein [Sulfuricurvum sp.]|uniref:hypothetical protein n=1 Tax=Sulfuricurvum sp. TaxID=2025608 RepID=UPI002608757C|nr:hypothetical protein [Sulfuricurvum sp.]MDD3595605.1 hypothetical protein [Sulfuricurvum sp.]
MSIENVIVVVVDLCMVFLGSVMLYTHTKQRWLLALFVLLSVGTAIMGWSMNYPAYKTIPLIMVYTIIAVEYSMVQMDKQVDALIGKEVNRSVKPPYQLILLIAVMLSGVVGALVTSPPSAMQSHIELIIAIVLIAIALVSRIVRILLRGYQTSPKENL